MSSGSGTAPVVFLMGPTASGKTELACRLADRFAMEIVSVDSAMVYRGLDIGTAKPSPAVLAAHPHHLIDIRDPAETYSAAQFRLDALSLIAAIHDRGRIPLLVGGTGLYFRVLEQGIADLPDADAAVRERLSRELAQDGSVCLHARLREVDPDSAARIHPNDPQRILRALEVFEQTGHKMSTLLQKPSAVAFPGTPVKLVLAPCDRAVLHARIAQRFRAMLEAGFVDEVAALRSRPDLHPDTPALRAVGYRAIWRYLDGRYTAEEMFERGVIATRQLAKRQFTWFRRVPDAQWFDAGGGDGAGDEMIVALKRDIKLQST